MTLPDEERRAINRTRDFLVSLLDPRKTPRVPLARRHEACRLLKHYPSDYQVDRLYDQVIKS